MAISTISLSPSDLEGSMAVFMASGFLVETPPAPMVTQGIVLVAWNPQKDEGFILSPAEIRLVAHYQDLRVLDPGWLDSKLARHSRAGEPNREAKYVEAALARAVHEMRSATEGSRNQTLNKLVYDLGKLEALGLRYERVHQEMLEAATAVGLPISEIEATLKSSWKRGTENPKELPLSDPTSSKFQPLKELKPRNSHLAKLERKFRGRK